MQFNHIQFNKIPIRIANINSSNYLAKICIAYQQTSLRICYNISYYIQWTNRLADSSLYGTEIDRVHYKPIIFDQLPHQISTYTLENILNTFMRYETEMHHTVYMEFV